MGVSQDEDAHLCSPRLHDARVMLREHRQIAVVLKKHRLRTHSHFARARLKVSGRCSRDLTQCGAH